MSLWRHFRKERQKRIEEIDGSLNSRGETASEKDDGGKTVEGET